MPHLHDEEKPDNDEESHVTACSKSVESGCDSVCSAAESAANKLLSLAVMAEQHGKSHAEPVQKQETELTRQVKSHPPSPSVAHPVSRLPPFEDGRRHPSPSPPGMGPRWGVVGHPPTHPHFRGFVRQGMMHRVYPGPMGGPVAGGSPVPMGEHPMRYMHRGGGRGGFPMWTGSPRPPYRQPPVHGASPSQLPPAFRNPLAQPYMARQCSSNDDDNSVTSGRGPAKKRLSAGYPTKSILKKPRVETPTTALASEANASPAEEDAAKEASTEFSNYPLAKTVSTTASTDASVDTTEVQTKTTIESVVVQKASFSGEDVVVKRQRIISPASSNEYQKSEHDEEYDNLSPEQRNRIRSHEAAAASPGRHYHLAPPFRMGHPPPPVQGMHCGPRHPGGHYMPPGHMYPHHGMRPFPPLVMSAVTAPGMFPPRSMSSRGRPGGFPGMSPYYARARMDASPSPSSISPEQQRPEHGLEKPPQPPSSASPVPSAISRQSGTPTSVGGMDALGDVSGSANRCIPLTPPVPSKYWSDADTPKDVILPDFHRLVNFPDLLVKGRNAAGDSNSESGAPNALCGKKRCVMCGQLRVSATYVRSKKANAEESAEGSSGAAGISNNGSSHIIPRQNKGVCTACDVTVWVALELEGMEIKWCKGCKNFRPWSHFGDKSLATKCLRCRDRQKEKYALQKSASRRRSSTSTSSVEEKKTEEDCDMHNCSLALVAANGLRNLMNAR